jgi:DNA replication protein DnaC
MELLTNAIGRALPATLRVVLGEATKVCDQHGEYQATGQRIMITTPPREIWTGCPACQADAALAKQDQAAQKRSVDMLTRVQDLLKQTAIPSRFIGRTLDNYAAETEGQAKALSTCQRYAAQFGRASPGASLILSGLPGTGKSHLAGGILQALLPHHVGAYVTMMDLIRMLRDTWRRDSDQSETDVLAKLTEVPLLVIDEIGVQYGTDAERTLFFDVMDRRYRNCMPVILLTNQGRAEFRTTVGDRVYDRLTEVAKWVPFDWPSHRAQMRKEFKQ